MNINKPFLSLILRRSNVWLRSTSIVEKFTILQAIFVDEGKRKFPFAIKNWKLHAHTDLFLKRNLHKLDQSLETRATSHNTVSLDS